LENKAADPSISPQAKLSAIASFEDSMIRDVQASKAPPKSLMSSMRKEIQILGIICHELTRRYRDAGGGHGKMAEAWSMRLLRLWPKYLKCYLQGLKAMARCRIRNGSRPVTALGPEPERRKDQTESSKVIAAVPENECAHRPTIDAGSGILY
jgi:hypothetical protein